MGKDIEINVDKTLLLQVAQGDKNAFRKIYEVYSGTVHHTIKKYISDEEECRELTQQIFIRLWERRDLLSTVRHFGDYLFIMTRNRVYRYFTQLRKEAEIIRSMQNAPDLTDPGSYLDAELREYYVLWQQAVETLPAQQKQVYTLIEKKEMSLDSVSAELQIARATVKKHLELARRAVRQFITIRLNYGNAAKVLIPLAVLTKIIF